MDAPNLALRRESQLILWLRQLGVVSIGQT